MSLHTPLPREEHAARYAASLGLLGSIGACCQSSGISGQLRFRVGEFVHIVLVLPLLPAPRRGERGASGDSCTAEPGQQHQQSHAKGQPYQLQLWPPRYLTCFPIANYVSTH